MLNYTTMSTASPGGRFSNYDILSDLADDIHGLHLTLMAIADQPCVIDPAQLHTLSAIVSHMADAMRDVLENMPQGAAAPAASAAEGVA